MTALLELKVQNFKSLKSVTVPLTPLTVLVGPNGSGKSNLLDVIQFLGDSVRADLRPAVDVRGGFDRVLFRGETALPSFRIEVKANVTQFSSVTAPDEYTLHVSRGTLRTRAETILQPGTPRHFLARRETFKFKRYAGRGRRITVQGGRAHIIDQKPSGEQSSLRLGLQQESLGLAALPRLSDKEGGTAIRALAELFSTFRVFDVDVAAARRPVAAAAPTYLEPDGSNLSGFLYSLAQSEPDVFDQLASDAKELVPGLREMVFEEVGGPTSAVAVSLIETGIGKTYLSEASYGTIRTLALLALLYDPHPPKLTCVEEIDHGLHPYAFDLLAERLRDAARESQFLIATHSPAFVNRLKPDELVVCERSADGSSRIPAISRRQMRDIAEELEGDYGLGEVWFTGMLGGVP